MTNPRKPFRLNVGFIIHEEVGYSHEFPFEFNKIKLGDDLELRGFQGSAVMDRTPQGILVLANFSGTTTLECVRCLKNFDQLITSDLTELYAFKKKSESESELLLPEDAHIDLEPLLREYALLEIPINPLCQPDCKGLCPVCGENLNDKDCGHRPEQDASPFASLKNLL